MGDLLSAAWLHTPSCRCCSREGRPLHNRHSSENSRPPPHAVIPAKSLPRTPIRGRYPVPAPWIPVYVSALGRPYFHPLMWPAQGHSDSGEKPAPYSIRGWNPGAVGQLGLRRFGPHTSLYSGSHAKASEGGKSRHVRPGAYPSPAGYGSPSLSHLWDSLMDRPRLVLSPQRLLTYSRVATISSCAQQLAERRHRALEAGYLRRLLELPALADYAVQEAVRVVPRMPVAVQGRSRAGCRSRCVCASSAAPRHSPHGRPRTWLRKPPGLSGRRAGAAPSARGPASVRREWAAMPSVPGTASVRRGSTSTRRRRAPGGL